MVGAMADWFAVTALFKHPLGLPIPHTALIPKRKDDLGRGLEEFVGENFLQEGIIRDRVAAATISLRVGRWLERPGQRPPGGRRGRRGRLHRARQGHRRARAPGSSRTRWCRGSARSRSRRCWAACSTRWSATTCTTALVDLAVDELGVVAGGEPRHLRRGPRGAGAVVGAAAAQRRGDPPGAPPSWSTGWSTSATTRSTRPGRPSTRCSRQLAHDLLHDPDTQARTERLKDRLLDHPQVLTSSVDLWNALRRALQASLNDPSGAVRSRLLTELSAFAERLVDDADLRRRLDLTGRRRRGVRRRPLRRRADRRDHPHHRALGRQGGRPAHRAARRPRPAVHPDQRHHRRRPGRRAHPRVQRGVCSRPLSLLRSHGRIGAPPRRRRRATS